MLVNWYTGSVVAAMSAFGVWLTQPQSMVSSSTAAQMIAVFFILKSRIRKDSSFYDTTRCQEIGEEKVKKPPLMRRLSYVRA
jgi:hypothetical protein